MSDETTSASNEKDEPATGKMKPSSRTVNVEQLVARDLPVLFGRYEIQSVLKSSKVTPGDVGTSIPSGEDKVATE